MPTIENPYTDSGMWLRGNLHAHTTESDGVRDPERVAADYAARGYDFLAITDHDTLTLPSSSLTEALIEIPAVEVSANGPHTLHVDASKAVPPTADRQSVVEAITDDHGLAIPAHPNWQESFGHWPQDRLLQLDGYEGIEIYNGTIEHLPGSALATDRWDQLLSSGRLVWGFGNDDSHRPWEVETAWNVVQVDERSKAAILASLSAGRFYASTGVTVESIEVVDGLIQISTGNADTIRLISDHGVVQQIATGPNATFHVPDQLVHRGPEYSYVRIECHGPGMERAWLQPMALN